MLAVGEIIGGRLRIDRVLGSGGMGIVLAATHLELGHRVAIKVLHDGLAHNAETVERFLREARAVVALRTEHVCRVLDVSRLPSGAPYIVMELLEGADLARVASGAPVPLEIAVDYVMQACVALAEAHALGIVHRDLKPANLFLTRGFDGGPLVKVLDFGLAKALDSSAAALTSDGLLGSPAYMSPEQIQSPAGVDVRTDIWSLGVTLYQLLSRRLPFVADSVAGVAVRISTVPPEPLDVDPALRAILWRCLEKDRTRRYPDVAELARDLARFGGRTASALAAIAAQILYKQGSSYTVGTETPLGPAAPPVAAFPVAGAASPSQSAPPATAHAISGTATTQAKAPRWPLVAGAVIAIVGVVIAIALATRGDGGSKPSPVAAETRDAAVSAVTVTASAAPPPLPNAGEPSAQPADTSHEKTVQTTPNTKVATVTANGASPQPTAPQSAAPRPASPHPASPQPASPQPVATQPASPQPTSPQPASDHPVWAAACSKVSSKLASFAPPGLITKCMCLKRDQAAAQTAYLRISPDDRESPRAECTKLGIKLHE